MVWNSNCDHFTYISFKKYLGSKDLKTSCILGHPTERKTIRQNRENVLNFYFSLLMLWDSVRFETYQSFNIFSFDIKYQKFALFWPIWSTERVTECTLVEMHFAAMSCSGGVVWNFSKFFFKFFHSMDFTQYSRQTKILQWKKMS